MLLEETNMRLLSKNVRSWLKGETQIASNYERILRQRLTQSLDMLNEDLLLIIDKFGNSKREGILSEKERTYVETQAVLREIKNMIILSS
jgi:hypothetical protein